MSTSRFALQTLRTVAVLCVAGLFSVDAAQAADPAACAGIADDSERLVCYDTVFRHADVATDDAPVFDEALTAIEARRAEEAIARASRFSLVPHRPNYILPATYNATDDYRVYGPAEDELAPTEIKFQLSLKSLIASDLWRGSTLHVAYTQQAYWQLYADDELSAPFRETNYQPEVIWQIPLEMRIAGFTTRFASLAFNHQSNGRGEPLSRSWNRVIGEIVADRGNLVLSARGWWRVPEDDDEDDNPDIQEFMGRAQLGAAYKLGEHTLSMGLKSNLRRNDHRGAVELDWTFPLHRQVKGFVQFYSGHGENLIDMENVNNRIGIGIAISDWL